MRNEFVLLAKKGFAVVFAFTLTHILRVGTFSRLTMITLKSVSLNNLLFLLGIDKGGIEWMIMLELYELLKTIILTIDVHD